jgi:hypothetical protein
MPVAAPEADHGSPTTVAPPWSTVSVISPRPYPAEPGHRPSGTETGMDTQVLWSRASFPRLDIGRTS